MSTQSKPIDITNPHKSTTRKTVVIKLPIQVWCDDAGNVKDYEFPTSRELDEVMPKKVGK
jgi:hypothetical protein